MANAKPPAVASGEERTMVAGSDQRPGSRWRSRASRRLVGPWPYPPRRLATRWTSGCRWPRCWRSAQARVYPRRLICQVLAVIGHQDRRCAPRWGCDGRTRRGSRGGCDARGDGRCGRRRGRGRERLLAGILGVEGIGEELLTTPKDLRTDDSHKLVQCDRVAWGSPRELLDELRIDITT